MAIKAKLRSRKKTAAERVDPCAFVYLMRGGQYRGTFGQKSKVAGLKSPSHEAVEAHKASPPRSVADKKAIIEQFEKDTLPQLQSPLFQVPPEIRNKIYEYCADVCMRQDGVNYLFTDPPTGGTCKYPALLKSCKRIAQEAHAIVLSSQVEIRATRLGMFYKTVGPFIPVNVRHVHIHTHELVNPYLLTISLERILRGSNNIESAKLTTYTRKLHKVTGEYQWERPKALKKEQYGEDGGETYQIEKSHPVDLIAAVSCWHDRAALRGFHLPVNQYPHHKWMVVQFEDKSHRVRSFDNALNLAIRRQDEWCCVYRSEKLEELFSETLKREAEIVAKSENPELMFR
ncbi:hypothetical protein PG993_014796 [Apiospora rasikravindrae]|uniref:Uncharacterized protein n=1 Tax=Apiospora rasikravindrae TaxID=990691 RepID=A0ABR1RNZ4_9PEZI